MSFQKSDPFVLGIDVGVASLGLAGVCINNDLERVSIIDGSVLLYPIPTGAAERREKRSARKNIDRKQQRLQRIEKLFIDNKIGCAHSDFTESYSNQSPYTLRAKASREKLDLIQFQIALMNMAKHRGSSAIREQDIGDETEKRQTAVGMKKLRAELQRLKFDTYGQYLRYREKRNLPLRLNSNNPRLIDKEGFLFYPSRTLLMEEFEFIWQKQSQYHPHILTPQLKQELHAELFFQRSITPPPAGRCPFYPAENKLHRNTLLFQKRRIYEDLNHLKFTDKLGNPLPFTLEQRDRLASLIMKGIDLNVTQIKKELGHPNTVKINLDDMPSKQKKIKAYPYARLTSDEDICNIWNKLTETDQQQLLDILNTTHDDLACQQKIQNILTCSEDLAERFMQIPFPSGYGHAGKSATEELMAVLLSEVISTRQAQDKAGLTHEMEADGLVYDYLPYYGEILQSHVVAPIWVHKDKRPTNLPPETNPAEAKFGRIPNPVVHIALNQIRKAVNEFIRKYGKPTSIHIELSRQLNKSAEERDEITKQQTNNQIDNDKIRKEIKKLGLTPNRLRLQRYKLWKEQKYVCIYSGQPIELSELFEGEVDVDHILPRSKTFSDSLMNKVVCLHSENSFKNNRSPYDAFHQDDDKWAAILRRVDKLPQAKQWRFQADAMEKFDQDPESYRARYGNDNSYIARVARLYLGCLYGETTPVVAVSSYITSLLRGKWGLQTILGNNQTGQKSRDDHRHHFIDALVVACSSRSIINAIQREAARCEAAGLEDFAKKIPPPAGLDSTTFLNQVRKFTFENVKIARKPNHSTFGQLHEDTLMGIVDPTPNSQGRYLVVKRKNITDYNTQTDLEKVTISDNISENTRVEKARQKLEALKNSLKQLEAQATAQLEEKNAQLIVAGKKTKKITDRARYKVCCDLLKKQNKNGVIEIFSQERLVNLRYAEGSNKPTGGYISGRNHHIEFYLDNKGKVQWQLISMLEANNPDFVATSRLAGNTYLWSLHKDDMVEMKNPDNPNQNIEYRVAKFSAGKMNLVPLSDARDSKKRKEIKERGLRYYCQHALRPIVKNPIGDVVWKERPLPESGQMDIS